MKIFLGTVLFIVALICFTKGFFTIKWGDNDMRILGQIANRDGFKFQAFQYNPCHRAAPAPQCIRHFTCEAAVPTPPIVLWSLITPEGRVFRHEAENLHEARNAARFVSQGRFVLDN